MKIRIRNLLREAAAGLCAAALLFSCTAAEQAPAGEIYVSERISRNYTRVSAAYTMPAYAGEDIVLSAADAETESAGRTGETEGYTGGDTVLRVRFGDTVRLRAEVPEDGLYALRVDT